MIAAAEKIAATETDRFFAERKGRADRKAFRRILNRKGGAPPKPEDTIGEMSAFPGDPQCEHLEVQEQQSFELPTPARTRSVEFGRSR